MPCPIEQAPSQQLGLFQDEGPQSEALGAETYDEFLCACSRMRPTCCRVGETNNFAPPVMCDGNIRGRVILVGEAPGKKERELGVPFVGPAGNLLRMMLIHAKIPERAFYMINILKCRPFDELTNKDNPAQTAIKDRRPTPEEAEACFPLLLKQVHFTQAQYVVFLGASSAVACLGLKPTFKILDYAGYGVPLLLGGTRRGLGLVLPHPSYFLHNKGDELRYTRCIDLLRNINVSLLSEGRLPMTFQLLPEELFHSRKKPSYFERKGAGLLG